MPRVLRSLKLPLDTRLQVDHRAVLRQIATNILVHHRPATGREYDILSLRQFRDAISLPLAKTGLALFFEDKGDIHASAALDLGIAVKELQAKLFGELASYGGQS